MRLDSYVRLFNACWLFVLGAAGAPAVADTLYTQTNLVSDLPAVAAHTDANLANPWGIDWGKKGPFWISDNKTGRTTIYDGTGAAVKINGSTFFTIPPPGGAAPPAAPTGVVFSGEAQFAPDNTGARPAFLFATEDGTIAGWGGAASAVRRVDNSASGAVYKGIAITSNASNSLLYATNFNAGKVDTFDANFVATPLAGSFSDSNIPKGFAPFNIESINGELFVTYAKQDAAKHDDVAGAGNGFIDVFNSEGMLLRRFASNGPLNSPWGMALAPAGFGQFAGDLLVGNFGDGKINAFNPKDGSFVGQLKGKNGPIELEGLWGLKFGNNGKAGDANTLFFTAGIAGPGVKEDHGLFGSLSVVPEPTSSLLLVAGLGLVAALRLRKRRRN